MKTIAIAFEFSRELPALLDGLSFSIHRGLLADFEQILFVPYGLGEESPFAKMIRIDEADSYFRKLANGVRRQKPQCPREGC